MAQATILKPGQYRHLLRVTEATSRDPERHVLVLLLGIMCGMRVSEIAQIQIQDVLFPSGAIRQEVSPRAAITKGSTYCSQTQNKVNRKNMARSLTTGIGQIHSAKDDQKSGHAVPKIKA